MQIVVKENSSQWVCFTSNLLVGIQYFEMEYCYYVETVRVLFSAYSVAAVVGAIVLERPT
jgi:hypothetical protein